MAAKYAQNKTMENIFFLEVQCSFEHSYLFRWNTLNFNTSTAQIQQRQACFKTAIRLKSD